MADSSKLDPPSKLGPLTNEEAFAATVAPHPVTHVLGSGALTQPEDNTDHLSTEDQALASCETVAAPTTEPPAPTAAQPLLPQVDAALYTTDKEIARGGMGRIVAAEDRRLGRRVALKELLQPSADQIGRFQREALITARLQHPGIVPVYEAGRWPSGEPFFAMKLVQGRPLDRVIGEARSLGERLALLPRLAAACDAIAYAHSQRVIHRDLKPGNVLIGDFGETVVIDWGLAKDLDAAESPESATRAPRPHTSAKPTATSQSSTLTIAGSVMGTPAYMAPEQARGEPLDSRADVFALGAMLYHLLAGVPPYNARTATDVIAQAAIGRVVPLRERERRAPFELVAIVERAMAMDPAARYDTASGLADELRRFLTGQLVAAHRYRAIERVARFVRRHRAAVAIGTLAAIGFAVGGTLAVRRVVSARDLAQQQERLASTRQVAAEKLVDHMLDDVKQRLESIGRLDLLASIGTDVKDYYDALAATPGVMLRDDEVRMAAAIELVGRVEHASGRPDKALDTWSDERNRLASIASSGGASHALRAMIARLDFDRAMILQERGKIDDALATYRRARDEWDELKAADPNARDVLIGSADTHDRIGDLLRNEGKIDQAFDEYSAAKLEREKAARGGNGRVSNENVALSTSHFKLASIYQNRGQSSVALDEYRAAQRLRRTLVESQPDNLELQRQLLEVEDQLAELERQVGDSAAAIATYRRALPVTELLVHRDPANVQWLRQRGDVLADFGLALLDGGSFAEARTQLEAAIAIQKDLVQRDPKSTRDRNDLARSYTRYGDALVYLGALDDGIARYAEGLDIRKELVARAAKKSVPLRRATAWSYAKLANAFFAKNDLQRALDAHEQALALRSAIVAESPSQGDFKNELASTEIELAKLVAARDGTRTSELLDDALARARSLVANDQINNEFKETLVQALVARAIVFKLRGDVAIRRAALDEALVLATEGARRSPTNWHWGGHLAEIRIERAELARDLGDAKTAAAEWQHARDVLEPMAKAGRLPAPRKPLLDRARAGR
jgi:tetratricopeptide (TPR) repeat protein